MTNVDVAALASELSRALVGARVDKAYQPAKDRILLRMRQKGLGKMDVLFQLGKFITVTKRPVENPDQPSMVAKILRRDYGNARLIAVSQVGFDRLLRFDFERDAKRSLVFELFGDGNMLLLDDQDVIALPMKGGDYGARRLRKGEPYQPPPGGALPFAMDLDAMKAKGADARRDLVRFLALDLGFGPQWAEELCLRAAVDKTQKPQELPDAEWQRVHDAIHALGGDIRRNDLAPAVIFEGETPIDAVPFEMLKFPREKHPYEEAPSFREALDAYFIGGDEDEDDDPRKARFEEARGKVLRQVQMMEEAINGFKEDEEQRRLDGDTLYAQFQEVDKILAQLQAARATRSWQEVEAILRGARESGDPAAQVVQEIRPHNGTGLFRLTTLEGESRDIEVDLYKSVQMNADDQYSAAKKAKARQDGAATALAEAKARVQAVEDKGLDGFGAAPQKTVRVSRHFWFENYRWTLTPSGLIAVGGRNAAQNDMVVKKYLREGDRYVHADIHGAPSVVVRPADGAPRDMTDEDMLAAGQFAVCSSRAWRQFGAATAYWVTPAQVNKTPRSGEFVPKGAWIIHGKRTFLTDLPVEWMVGMVRLTPDGTPLRPGEEHERTFTKLAGGPPACIKPFAEDALRLVPGDMEPAEASQMLAERYNVDIEDAQAALPPGPVRVA